MNDPYELHRLALAPLLRRDDADTIQASISGASHGEDGLALFIDFVIQQGLGPLWHDQLWRNDALALIGKTLDGRLAASHYMLQRTTTELMRNRLDAAGIVHTVYKGVANRELLFKEPTLRPAADIDLLVASADRDRTIRLLMEDGFSLHVNPANVSHEVTLQRGAATVDLHWDILRPGRTRQVMTPLLLAARQDTKHWWRSDGASALYVALVHPVFAKYATAPQSTLIRVVELIRLLQQKIDVGRTLELAQISGLKSAAWIMVRWLRLLIGESEYEALRPLGVIEKATEPGKLRRRHLNLWIDKNLATRLASNPLLIQGTLTLGAHDTLGDVRRAVREARRMEKQSAAVSGQLNEIKKAFTPKILGPEPWSG